MTTPLLTVSAEWGSLFREPARSTLERVLPGFLRTRRWFGGKAREITSARIVDAVPVSQDALQARLCLIRVEYRGSPAELYQLTLAYATGESAVRMLATGSPAVVARLRVEHTDGVLLGATWDPRFGSALLEAIGTSLRLPGLAGNLLASHTTAFPDAVPSVAELPPPVRSGGEQSNTSLRFGDRLILKLFRRVEPGINPDLEIGSFLTELAGFPHVPPALGSLVYQTDRGELMTVGLLQGLVANQGDAWSYTLECLGRFYERVRSRPPPPPTVPADQQSLLGDYVAVAELLGRRTAELHLALASRPDHPDFAPEPFTPPEPQRLFQSIVRMSQEVFGLLQSSLEDLAPNVRSQAEGVIHEQPQFLERVRSILEGPITAARIRHHGDYHLGQVLWTGHDVVIIDFEGEPARPLDERRRKGSPLRDVAGMIRSFHYAAHHGLAAALAGETSHRREEPAEAMKRWAELWYHLAAETFLASYREAARGALFFPESREELDGLLFTFLFEKAVYELGYELNNRPDWIWLPLRGIAEAAEVAI